MLFENKKSRYLFIGVLNTVIGYSIGIFIYQTLAQNFNIFLIGLVANVLAISISFCNFKLFVFKTKGNWLSEYLKAYIVYGGNALISICLLWFFIEQLSLNIWFVQLIIIVLTTMISFIGHRQFTFGKSINQPPK
jgi:putative flippase GtrA